MGTIGGSLFHTVIGYKNAAKGSTMRDIMREVRVRSPLLGVQFAAWGGMFSAVDCTMVAIRKKEDMLNSIISGGVTGALLTIRSGPGVMFFSGLVGAMLLGAIEGAGLIVNHVLSPRYDASQPQTIEDPKSLPTIDRSSTSNMSAPTSTTPFGFPQFNNNM